MSDIDDLIDYLDVGLDLATLDEMPLADLARLKELLYHWHALAERAHREHLAASRDEETE